MISTLFEGYGFAHSRYAMIAEPVALFTVAGINMRMPGLHSYG